MSGPLTFTRRARNRQCGEFEKKEKKKRDAWHYRSHAQGTGDEKGKYLTCFIGG